MTRGHSPATMGSSRDYSTWGPHWGPPPGLSSHNRLCVALKHQAAGVPKPSTRGFLSPQGPVWSGPPPLTTHSVPSFSPAHASSLLPTQAKTSRLCSICCVPGWPAPTPSPLLPSGLDSTARPRPCCLSRYRTRTFVARCHRVIPGWYLSPH